MNLIRLPTWGSHPREPHTTNHKPQTTNHKPQTTARGPLIGAWSGLFTVGTTGKLRSSVKPPVDDGGWDGTVISISSTSDWVPARSSVSFSFICLHPRAFPPLEMRGSLRVVSQWAPDGWIAHANSSLVRTIFLSQLERKEERGKRKEASSLLPRSASLSSPPSSVRTRPSSSQEPMAART